MNDINAVTVPAQSASAASASADSVSAPASGVTHDIVCIGASAGAIPTLQTLLGTLPGDFAGTLFVVVHMSPRGGSELAGILSRAGTLPAVTAGDLVHWRPGCVYVAPADCHMLLEGEHVRVVRGPKENRHRPAIDPLFRSAAWSFGPRVVGVVLTGYLDDGAAGLWAVRSCGGVAVVQDPNDALFRDMPENALNLLNVDHVLPVAEIGALLVRLARQPVDTSRSYPRPESLRTEMEFAAMERDRDIKDMGSLGKLSPFTCPACRGALWELEEGDLLRYRCHTGHAYSSDSLILEQDGAIEEGLYSALRAVEEKATALRRLSERWRGRYPHLETDYLEKADEMDRSAHALRHLLSQKSD